MMAAAALGIPWPLPPLHPHYDVWVVMLALADGYLYAVYVGRRGRRDDSDHPSARQVACFLSGVALMWVVSDWPMHDIAEDSLFAAHMVQHMVIGLIAPAMLLAGTPRWLAEWLLEHLGLTRVAQTMSRPLVALLAYNGYIALTHWPVVVTAAVTSEPIHFALHATLFGLALAVWMPVLSPTPLIPHLTPPLGALYLFANSIVPTVPASFLTFGRQPLYPVYGNAAEAWGITALTDQLLAGLIMKLGGAAVLWAVIAAVWFRWTAQEQRWEQLEQQLRRG